MAETNGVFKGVKVLELGAGAAGPVATRYLADHGATVVRVESSKRPDFLRTIALTPDSKFGLDGGPMFVLMNANKLSVSINLSLPEGIEVVKRLIAWADVLSENFSPKAMAKWGLNYETLRAIKPDLV
ncbi:MAG: CoA transferase, partial [Deltaproteobacteria bacterium]|nr:CoA transferase [Deltaproteobacteria bacterium]